MSTFFPSDDKHCFEDMFLGRHHHDLTPEQKLALAVFCDAALCLRRDPISELYLETWEWATQPNPGFDFWAQYFRTDPDLLRAKFRKLVPEYVRMHPAPRKRHLGHRTEISYA